MFPFPGMDRESSLARNGDIPLLQKRGKCSTRCNVLGREYHMETKFQRKLRGNHLPKFEKNMKKYVLLRR